MNQNKRDNTIGSLFRIPNMERVWTQVKNEFSEEEYSLELLKKKFDTFQKSGLTDKESFELLIKAAVELTTQEAPKWEMIAARFRFLAFENEIDRTMEEYGIRSFYGKGCFFRQRKIYMGNISWSPIRRKK